MAETETLTTDVARTVKKRLKVYSAATGLTIRFIVNSLLDEKLPPLPGLPAGRLRESEATT